MKTAFIIAEYNPFHNGHKYHIEQTRAQTGAECIAAVMSGNFVQRGEPAFCEKFARASAAVYGGADLVIELPVKYAVSNAAHFAEGAVKTIAAFGTGGILSFGASAGTDELSRTVEMITDSVFAEETRELSKKAGKSFPAAQDALLRQKGFSAQADLLQDANNVLAVEYIKSLASVSSLVPYSIKRTGNEHDDITPRDRFASAKYIREKLVCACEKGERNVTDEFVRYIPESTRAILNVLMEDGHCPPDRNKYNAAAFSRLLDFSEEYFRNIDNVTQGLENRITQAVKNNVTLDGLYDEIKSKRFTLARIRQIITQSVLGITREDTDSAPSYLRVLAFNERGREQLAQIRKTALLPIVTNLSDVQNMENCRRDAALEYTEDKLYDLCLPHPQGGNRPYLEHPVYIKKK